MDSARYMTAQLPVTNYIAINTSVSTYTSSSSGFPNSDFSCSLPLTVCIVVMDASNPLRVTGRLKCLRITALWSDSECQVLTILVKRSPQTYAVHESLSVSFNVITTNTCYYICCLKLQTACLSVLIQMIQIIYHLLTCMCHPARKCDGGLRLLHSSEGDREIWPASGC